MDFVGCEMLVGMSLTIDVCSSSAERKAVCDNLGRLGASLEYKSFVHKKQKIMPMPSGRKSCRGLQQRIQTAALAS